MGPGLSHWRETAVGSHAWIAFGAAVQAAAVAFALDPGAGLRALGYAVALALAVGLYYTLYRGTLAPSRRSVLVVGATAVVCLALAFALALPEEAMSVGLGGAAFALIYAYTGLELRSTPAFGVVKPLLLAAVWTCYTALLPSALVDDFDGRLLLARACFFLALALAFDHRDRRIDLRVGLRTLSARLGPTVAATCSCGLLLASGALTLWSGGGGLPPAAVALALTSLVGAGAVYYAFRQNRWRGRDYDFYLDGLLVLPLPIYLTLAWWWPG